MAQKNNIRSIRFSDALAELIDRQAGRTFTELMLLQLGSCRAERDNCVTMETAPGLTGGGIIIRKCGGYDEEAALYDSGGTERP